MSEHQYFSGSQADGAINLPALNMESARVFKKWNKRSIVAPTALPLNLTAPIAIPAVVPLPATPFSIKKREPITNFGVTYYGKMLFGSPAQPVDILLDTGSGSAIKHQSELGRY